MRTTFYLPLLLIIAALGCSKDSNPIGSTPYPPANPTAGEFGFVLNGTSFDRREFLTGSTADASLGPWEQGPPNAKLLEIDLSIQQGTFPNIIHTRTVTFLAHILAPVPATLLIGQRWSDVVNAYTTIYLDTVKYDSKSGGTLVITKFDTVTNVISGTFSFSTLSIDSKANPSDTETITSGYFNDVPIDLGSFGQGAVTANIDGYGFTSNSSRVNNITVDMYTNNGPTVLEMLASSTDSTVTRGISIIVNSPKVGDYDLSGLAKRDAFVDYSIFRGSSVSSLANSSIISGKLSITQFDTSSDRISGTFYLSGIDNRGNTVNITNGVIDHVQWFVK